MHYGKGKSPLPPFMFQPHVYRAPIWTLANGTIHTTAGWDANGGVYNTSMEPEIYLEVFDIMQSVPTSVPDLPACGVSSLRAGSALWQLT